MKISFNRLLNKKITRKEFLSYIGIMFLGIFGISSMIKSILQLNAPKKNRIQSKVKSAFGEGAYGV